MHSFPAIFWVASHYINHLPSVPLLCHSYEAGSQDTTCWLASFYQVSLGLLQDAAEWCQVLCFLLCFQHHYESICSSALAPRSVSGSVRGHQPAFLLRALVHMLSTPWAWFVSQVPFCLPDMVVFLSTSTQAVAWGRSLLAFDQDWSSYVFKTAAVTALK